MKIRESLVDLRGVTGSEVAIGDLQWMGLILLVGEALLLLKLTHMDPINIYYVYMVKVLFTDGQQINK